MLLKDTTQLGAMVLLATTGTHAADLVFPDGVWTFRGHGFVLHSQSNSSTYTFYEESAISCIQNDGLIEFLISAEITNDVATVWVDGPIAPYVADRSDDFVGGCASGVTPILGDDNYSRNALFDFDVLDAVFREHYAFFDLRSIDWNRLAAGARSNLTSDSTDKALMLAIISILQPLNDGHVNFASDAFFYTSKDLSFYDQLQTEFENQETVSDPEDYQRDQFMAWTRTVESYTSGGLNGEPFEFVWGEIEKDGDKIGYMQLQDFEPDNEEAFFDELDRALSDLAGTKTTIIDIRINSGGSDKIALEVASRFASERTLALTKQTWSSSGYTDNFAAYIEPCQATFCYDGDVIVIVSGSTVSAAEVFTLAMAQLPQTKVLGENTLGGLSDMLTRTLPNGWMFTLSNQEYMDPDGIQYEMVGFAPDIRAETSLIPLSERNAGIDSWLELALEEAVASDSLGSGATTVMLWSSSCMGAAVAVLAVALM